MTRSPIENVVEQVIEGLVESIGVEGLASDQELNVGVEATMSLEPGDLVEILPALYAENAPEDVEAWLRGELTPEEFDTILEAFEENGQRFFRYKAPAPCE